MDGKTHRKVGTATGAATAFVRSDSADALWQRLLETVGGAIAGNIGARIPDWLEPALHSHHRSIVHSVGFGATSLSIAQAKIAQWETYCRSRSLHFAERRRDPGTTGLAWFQCFVGELFWRMAVGFLGGVATGFGSHLLLDASTPRGIPLLIRGF